MFIENPMPLTPVRLSKNLKNLFMLFLKLNVMDITLFCRDK